MELAKRTDPGSARPWPFRPPSATFAFAFDRPCQDEGNNRVKGWVMVIIIMLKAAATQENYPICRIPISFLHALIPDL